MSTKSHDINTLLSLYKIKAAGSKTASLEAYHTFKEAALGGLSLASLASVAKKAPWGSLGKGLAFGTGAAVPAYLVGKHLVDYGTDEARNKALQVAGGTALLAGSIYGLHKLLSNKTQQAPKMASVSIDSAEIMQEKIEKLASAMYLDYLLSQNLFNADDTNGLTKEAVDEVYKINQKFIGDCVIDLIS